MRPKNNCLHSVPAVASAREILPAATIAAGRRSLCFALAFSRARKASSPAPSLHSCLRVRAPHKRCARASKLAGERTHARTGKIIDIHLVGRACRPQSISSRGGAQMDGAPLESHECAAAAAKTSLCATMPSKWPLSSASAAALASNNNNNSRLLARVAFATTAAAAAVASEASSQLEWTLRSFLFAWRQLLPWAAD